MSTKLLIVCDICGRETPTERDWNQATTSMEFTEVLAGTLGGAAGNAWPMRVTVKLPQGKHVCKYCVIAAVNALDDRVKEAPALLPPGMCSTCRGYNEHHTGCSAPEATR
jgi:hypothetical protein